MEEYVVVDLETTGLDPYKGCEIIEIGVTEIVNNEIIRNYSRFVKPKKEIPTLSGNVILEIKPGTQNYTKLKLKGKGIKTPNSLTRGNMYAVINIITPTKLDRKQKKLLQELAETNLEDAPEFKTFKKYL